MSCCLSQCRFCYYLVSYKKTHRGGGSGIPTGLGEKHTHRTSKPALSSSLAFTRYCFMSRFICTNQSFSLQTPPLCGHSTTPLHRPHCCALYCYPPEILYCNIYHTILVIAISCKGQAQARILVGSSAAAMLIMMATCLLVYFLVSFPGLTPLYFFIIARVNPVK